MKVRNGFVSNSSSSSFIIYGVCKEKSELTEIIESLPQDEQDAINDGEAVSEFWNPVGLDVVEDYEYGELYIGRSWDSIDDDETGAQFKESVNAKLSQIFSKEEKASTMDVTISG